MKNLANSITGEKETKNVKINHLRGSSLKRRNQKLKRLHA